MRVATGSNARIEASFVMPDGTPASLDADPSIEFYRDVGQDEVRVWEEVEVVVTNTGGPIWEAIFTVPEGATPGWVKAKWIADYNGSEISGEELFEVFVGVEVAPSDVERSLRRRLRDELSDPSDDSDAFFLNDEIHTLLALNNGSITGAAADGWMIRAAHYQTLVDIEESGSSRRLSQMFKNAQAMADFYAKAKASEQSQAHAARSSVVGVVASLRGEYVDTLGLAVVGYRGLRGAMYVRPFPLKRLITGIY